MAKTVLEEVIFLNQSDLAILVETCSLDEIWLPKSELEDDDWDMYSYGEEITIELPEWLRDENDM